MNENKSIADVIIEELRSIREAIEESRQELRETFEKLSASIDKIQQLGIPEEILITIIAEKAKVSKTTVKNVLRVIKNPAGMDDVLVYLISKKANCRVLDARKVLNSLKETLKMLSRPVKEG